MVNYRPVSLLLVCGKIFERLIFNPVFEFLEENRANFLVISKVCDKVRHEGLLYKQETVGISDNLHIIFQNFLSDWFQRVVVHDQSSNWSPILDGVPQGSVVGSLLFLVYIN